MAPRFGPIMQNGYVVRDLDRAMQHWTQVAGIGPFFVLEHIEFAEVLLHGKPAKFDISVAVG